MGSRAEIGVLSGRHNEFDKTYLLLNLELSLLLYINLGIYTKELKEGETYIVLE